MGSIQHQVFDDSHDDASEHTERIDNTLRKQVCNGRTTSPCAISDRSGELEELLNAVQKLVVGYVKRADGSTLARSDGQPIISPQENVLVESHTRVELAQELPISMLSHKGQGRDGLLTTIQKVLRYSVNTWDQGFLDKLSSSTNPVGVVSELVLATLNINLHVYHVSPALTMIEKHTARALASLVGFTGSRAGGVTCPGGSASNMTSLVIARNTLYPHTKANGNGTKKFVLFTSADAHYSVQKAAITMGLGTAGVIVVPVDESGCMKPESLRMLIHSAIEDGRTPFYVNATAGTTVRGSYDPFEEISHICKEFGLWLHVDGSWGGPVVFSAQQRYKLAGAELADSMTINPHKMLNVPVTCSFLLTNDLAIFHSANTLPADYLFHDNSDGEDDECWDLADLTLQCGRRGDALKLALSWVYYGAAGFERKIDDAFAVASYFANSLVTHPDFELITSNPPPCLQVCFYYTPNGQLASTKENTWRTSKMVSKLVDRGFMIDHAGGARGNFFRVVVNCQTLKSTIDGLIKALEDTGKEI